MTVGGSGDTIQECETNFGTSRQQLTRAIFKKLENQNFDAEIALADESVIDNVYDHSTVEELLMSDDFVDGQFGSGVGSRDVIYGLVQIQMDKRGYSEGKTLLKKGKRNNCRRNARVISGYR